MYRESWALQMKAIKIEHICSTSFNQPQQPIAMVDNYQMIPTAISYQ